MAEIFATYDVIGKTILQAKKHINHMSDRHRKKYHLDVVEVDGQEIKRIMPHDHFHHVRVRIKGWRIYAVSAWLGHR